MNSVYRTRWVQRKRMEPDVIQNLLTEGLGPKLDKLYADRDQPSAGFVARQEVIDILQSYTRTLREWARQNAGDWRVDNAKNLAVWIEQDFSYYLFGNVLSAVDSV